MKVEYKTPHIPVVCLHRLQLHRPWNELCNGGWTAGPAALAFLGAKGSPIQVR